MAVRTISTLDPTLGAAAITVKMPEVKDFQKRIKFEYTKRMEKILKGI